MIAQLAIDDVREIAENRLTVKYHIHPSPIEKSPIRRVPSATAPTKSTIVSGFGTSGAPEHQGARLGGGLPDPKPTARYELTQPTAEKLEIVQRKYPSWKKIEWQWTEALPDVHDEPELQAQNKALYREWNKKLNDVAKSFKPSGRFTFHIHSGGNCGRCGSELFFVPERKSLSYSSSFSLWRIEQCADCGHRTARTIGKRPFSSLRQKVSDLTSVFDMHDDRVQDVLNADARSGLSVSDLTVPAEGHREIGYQEIATCDGAKSKVRKPWPEWLGYVKTGKGRALGYNDQTMEVIYQMFPLLRQTYRTLTPEMQTQHREQVKEAAQIMAAVCRWFFWPSADERLEEELGIDADEVKALRRRFVDTGNFLHSATREMKYRAGVRFTKNLQLSRKHFAEWEITFRQTNRRKGLVPTCFWLPQPFNCQRPDRIIMAHWRVFLTLRQTYVV